MFVPFIPEESWEQVQETVEDLRDAMSTNTQTLSFLADRVSAGNEMMGKILEALNKPAESDGLMDLLQRMLSVEQRNEMLLRQVLTAVEKQ